MFSLLIHVQRIWLHRGNLHVLRKSLWGTCYILTFRITTSFSMKEDSKLLYWQCPPWPQASASYIQVHYYQWLLPSVFLSKYTLFLPNVAYLKFCVFHCLHTCREWKGRQWSFQAICVWWGKILSLRNLCLCWCVDGKISGLARLHAASVLILQFPSI